MPRVSYAFLFSFAVFGCATVQMPDVPEFHPANPAASEAARAPLFDILNVNPALPPELPVTEGEHHPPQRGEMGMEHDSMPMEEQKQEEASPPEHAHADAHPAAPPSPDKELYGVVTRPGMKEGLARPEPFQQKIKRGEARMEPIKIPHEQRGMYTDETLYHEHKPPYSTRIVHPGRDMQKVPVEGKREWACPMHPEVRAQTPGGRCPTCDTLLVPVKVDGNG